LDNEHTQEKRKVDFDVFVWVITILSGTMLAISSYLFTELSSARTNIVELNGRNEGLIKELSARLDAEREKSTSVLITLEQIKGTVQNIKDKIEQQQQPQRR